MTPVLKASPAILSVLSNSTIDDTGLVLPGELTRDNYVAVNKFLEVAGAKWNRSAKRHIFQPGARDKITALLSTGEIVDKKKALQKFYTPADIANRLARYARMTGARRTLEPSAGRGALADALCDEAQGIQLLDMLKCIEVDPEDVAILRGKGYDTVESDFMKLTPKDIGFFDRIVMNPPFTNDQDIKHVMHAMTFLAPGGRLIAIMSPGFTFGERRLRAEFRGYVEQRGAIVEELEPGAFKEAGTEVRCVIVELENAE